MDSPWGGDEFVVVLPSSGRAAGASLEDALAAADVALLEQKTDKRR